MSTVFERAKDELTLRPCKHQARPAALAAEESLPAWLARKRCSPASQLLQANAKLTRHAPVCWLQVAGHLFEGKRPKFTSLPSMSQLFCGMLPCSRRCVTSSVGAQRARPGHWWTMQGTSTSRCRCAGICRAHALTGRSEWGYG